MQNQLPKIGPNRSNGRGMMTMRYRRVQADHSPTQVAAIRTMGQAQQGAVAALQKEARQEGVGGSQKLSGKVLETKSASVAVVGVSLL